MNRLSSADLGAALEFVGEAHELEDVDAFRNGILPGLQRLLPCDLVGYNEVEPGGDALVLTYPWQVPEDAHRELPRLAHEHPLISVQLNGDFGAYKISDFLTARQFHGLELYAGLYSTIGAEDQIAFGIPGPAVIGIAMNRDRRSFNERDRAMLDLLRPHLALAHRRALERQHSAAVLAALERGLAERGSAVVLVGRNGSVAQLTGGALALLDRHFPERRGAGLPEEVREWLDAGARRPLVRTSPAGRMEVRARDGGVGRVLTLTEVAAIDPERLLALGLTRRQAEVLALLADGLGVEAVARELFVSVATVRKHLEHVYARLGVHSRAAAIARAREA